MNALFRLAIALVTLLLLASCVGQLKEAPTQQRMYLLTAESPARMTEKPLVTGPLSVRPMLVSPGYATRHLIYRSGADRYESDYYNMFLARPERLINQIVRGSLVDAGLFERVVQAGSVIEPAYVLESSLIALYADFHKGSVAVLKADFFLLQRQALDMVPVWESRLSIEEPLDDESADEVVAGMNRALTRMLEELTQGLAQVLPELKPASTERSYRDSNFGSQEVNGGQ